MPTTDAESPSPPSSSTAAFLAGLRAASTTVFTLVVSGTYIGIGALAHDYGFSLPWVMLANMLMWAAPAQVLVVTALGSGAAAVEVALAVGLSAARFLPMVVSLIPIVRVPGSRTRELILPAHFTAASTWVEGFRLLPGILRERRIAFFNGLGVGLICWADVGSVTGFYLAASLPELLTACLLFLTPLSFLASTLRNSRVLSDRLALALGLVVGPLLAAAQVGLDLMWTGLIAVSAAYGVHRLREALR
jgi:predicted branched-subunit amino acid permease